MDWAVEAPGCASDRVKCIKMLRWAAQSGREQGKKAACGPRVLARRQKRSAAARTLLACSRRVDSR